jgi:outer membrane protein assembly factor BamD
MISLRLSSLRIPVLFVVSLMIASCGLLPDKSDETKGWSANRLYSAARASLLEGDWEKSIELYQKLEARYPFGRQAQQAQLDMAYAQFKFDEPDSAVATLDRFAKLYPRHPNMDYALYLKGLVNFERGIDIIERFIPTDTTQRDAGAAKRSFRDFSVLVERFPDSKYSKDATQRLIYLRNNIAAYQIHVANYYLRRGAYVASVNRAETVLSDFDATPSIPDALAVIATAYKLMDIQELSDDAMKILALNDPEHLALKEVPTLQPGDTPAWIEDPDWLRSFGL